MPKDLPSNVEAEKAVLGSLLIDQDVAHLVFPILKPDNFYDTKHQKLYYIMMELESKGHPSDYITVGNRLHETGEYQEVGGRDYLIELMQSTPSSLHVEVYARIVKNYYKLRQLIISANKVLTTAYDVDTDNVNAVLDKAADTLYNVFRDEAEKSLVNSEQLMLEYWTNLEKRFNNPMVAETSTGFPELDVTINGYAPSDLVVVAGRPSWGKSSWIMSSILELGKSGVPIALFPYEMSRLQTSQRFISMMSDVPLQKIKSAVGLSSDELAKITKAVSDFSKFPIYIDSNSFGDIFYLTSAIRAYVSRHNVKVVFIDYLQIIPTHTDNLTIEYGMITRTLKTLATSLGITLVLVSQLNRNQEHRGGRPQLSDLRQSGRIEEDADVVLFIYRDTEGDLPEDGEVIVAKNRNGPRGNQISVLFEPETTHFIGRKI
jgi:replicative DNA helicase